MRIKSIIMPAWLRFLQHLMCVLLCSLSPVNKSISGSVQKRLSSLPPEIILRLNVTSETQLNQRSLSSLRHKRTTAADSPEIFLMPCAECQGVHWSFTLRTTFDLLKPIPILPITPNQKLWLFHHLSSPSCRPQTSVTRLFLEVKSLIWDGDCATGFPCAPQFQRLPGRQLGVRGHGNPPPRDSWENQKLDGGSASPCWQCALRLVRYLWVKK